jgi:hypothetical protein
MPTDSMSAAIRAGLNLERIEIHLDRFGRPPEVRLIGSVDTPRQPRAGLASEAVITTRHLGRLGEAWINEMREAFDATPPPERSSAG